MKKGIYILPNLITMGNMFFGFYAILAVFNGRYEQAAIGILIAGVMDGLDGRVARMTHSSSKFGIEFDSLSDLVSFGLAPALLMYSWALQPMGRLGYAAAFLFAVCGAMRLARFNVQYASSESKHFTGLPIPIPAGFIASIVILYTHFDIKIENPQRLLILTYFLAFLMVSTIRYRSFKELDFKKRKPFGILVAASLLLFLIASEPQIMLFALFGLYITSGLFEYLVIEHRVPLVDWLRERHAAAHHKNS